MEGTTIIAAAAAVAGLYYIWQSTQDSGNDPQQNPPTSQNPGGGDPILPPPGSDPIHAPISLIPPKADTTYQTSTADYPKNGFCGVAIGYRTTGNRFEVAWAPDMGLYDSPASCLGRQKVRDTAKKYLSGFQFNDMFWSQEYPIAWVTRNPFESPDPGTPNDKWPDDMGCYFYHETDGTILRTKCNSIIPMGTPDHWGDPWLG